MLQGNFQGLEEGPAREPESNVYSDTGLTVAPRVLLRITPPDQEGSSEGDIRRPRRSLWRKVFGI